MSLKTHVRIVQSSYVKVKLYGLNLVMLRSTSLEMVGDHVFGSVVLSKDQSQQGETSYHLQRC